MLSLPEEEAFGDRVQQRTPLSARTFAGELLEGLQTDLHHTTLGRVVNPQFNELR
jgi:hypothetical protein